MWLQVSEAEAPHGLEVGSVTSGQTQSVFDRGCRNQRVGETDAALSADAAGAFGHRAIDRDLPEWRKEGADQFGGGESVGFGPGARKHIPPTEARTP